MGPNKLKVEVITVLIIFVLAVFGGGVNAAPGDLDLTFGNQGLVSTNIQPTAAWDLSIQNDGKIVAVGTGFVGSKYAFAVVRYNTNGSLDTNFGNGGIVLTAIGNGNSQAYSVGVQSDGKIIVGGYSVVETPSGSGPDFAIVRYNTNGSLDSTFGNSGVVTTAVGNFVDTINDLKILSDGKILAAGDSSGQSSMAIVKYNSNGSLDTTFGNNGIQRVTYSGLGRSLYCNALAIQSDGKIILAGYSLGSVGYVLLARLNSNGSIDTAFGTTNDGLVFTTLTNLERAIDVAIQNDGKIIICGQSGTGQSQRVLVIRYNSNGTTDSNFGTNGIITTAVGNSYSTGGGITIQPNGKIIVVGQSSDTNIGTGFLVIRYNPNGSLDSGFGNSGTVVTRFQAGGFPLNSIDGAYKVVLQPNGYIVVCGGTIPAPFGINPTFALVRYIGDTQTTSRIKLFDYDNDQKTDLSIFRPSNGQWWLNQSSNGNTKVYQFGQSTDKIVPADYTGDGKTDVAFFRDGTWFVLRSENDTFFAAPFGTTGDIPAPGDFDADGKADLAVFRSTAATWFILQSTAGTRFVQFGANGDVPTVGDYDGDGKADVAIFRPTNGQWWLNWSSNNTTKVYQFGQTGDKVVQADYTGDGKTDVAFFRNGQWFILRSENETFYAAPFGAAGDIPAPGDYDGDGKADLAVFRPTAATWFILRSTQGALIQQFGASGDVPTPSAYIP